MGVVWIIFDLTKVLLYIYIKIAITSLLLINALAIIEMRQILNLKAHKNTNNRVCNKAIYPPLVTSIGKDTPIGELIYSKYKLLVFNHAYARVMYGRFYFIKSLKPILVLRILFYYVTGISRVLLITVSTILKIKKKTPIEVLYDFFIYPTDNRMLIRINGVWIPNGDKIKLANLLSSAYDKLGKKIEFSLQQINYITDLHKATHGAGMRGYEMVPFTDKNKPQIIHKGFLDITPGNNTAMETSKAGAVRFKNYGKDVIVSSYMGDKKESTLLVENIDNITQNGIVKYTPITKQLIGAITHGANTALMTRTYKEDYEKMIEITQGIEHFIKITGWAITKEEMLSFLGNTQPQNADNIIETIKYINNKI